MGAATGAGTSADEVRKIVARVAAWQDRPIAAIEWRPVDHRVENMTTERLDRCRVTFTDGGEISMFAKTLQPANRSPAWEQIPAAFHEQVLIDLDWRDEPRIYRSSVGQALPAPLRMPLVYAIDERDDHITLWLEDVADEGSWDLGRYARTAESLGRMSATLGRPALAAAGWLERNIRHLFFGKIVNHDLVILRDDAFWESPVIRAATSPPTRDDLEWLAAVTPSRLDRLDAMPQVAAHGDATPDNFREPGDGSIAALDWSYASWAAPGADLGQLLVGRFESGAADPDNIGEVAETILDAYLRGAACSEQGRSWARADVEEAFATTMGVRSVFSALIVDHRPDLDQDARDELIQRRGGVVRFGLDLARRTAARQAAATNRRCVPIADARPTRGRATSEPALTIDAHRVSA